MKAKGKLRLLRGILLVIMAACLVPVGQSCCQSIIHERQQREMKGLLTEDGIGKPEAEGQRQEQGDGDNAGPEIAEKWKELYAQNNDLIGWLTVEGTKIDYPVMRCGDDEFYLNHNFYKEEDKYGCLFVKDRADVDTPGTNFIIYGHHMKDDSMFGELDKYESESFCREHGEITFETLYEERMYEVISVFRTQITEEENEDGFKYYQFYQADTEEEFRNFYDNVMTMSIYDTGVTAEFGDTFLTLSTCSGYAENGRFVVVAKKAGR